MHEINQPPTESGASTLNGIADQNDTTTQDAIASRFGSDIGSIDESPVLRSETVGEGASLPRPETTKAAATANSENAATETLRDAVVRMVAEIGCKLFHDRNSNTFVTVPINDHRETWRLRADGFRRLLRHRWYQANGQGLGSSVISDALDTLDANAAYSEIEQEVHIRIAHHESGIYVDLCDEQWRAVHISKNGWSIVQSPPVQFVRTKGMLPLPLPILGGSVDALRPLINAGDEDVWCLVVAWILAAYSPGPFPILVLLGEQGCAKSNMSRVLRHLIDPSEVEVTTAPKESRDVIMAANNSYVVALDNLSGIPPWLSDLLCSVATGAAYRERKYHTNNGDEELFKAKRPLILNGIEFAMRDDLLSRSFVVTLPIISDGSRKDEAELLSALTESAPSILGAVFDCLSAILKNLPSTKLDTKPRMADATLWVTSAEQSLKWEAGRFLETYNGNRNQSVELALESDSFGLALHQFMMERAGETCNLGWQELVDQLGGQQKVGWPKNSKAVASRLTRLAPALRHVGIHWTRERNGARRFYRIWADLSHASNLTKTDSDDVSDRQSFSQRSVDASHDVSMSGH